MFYIIVSPAYSPVLPHFSPVVLLTPVEQHGSKESIDEEMRSKTYLKRKLIQFETSSGSEMSDNITSTQSQF